MAKSNLITTSLLGSIDWALTCPESWKPKSIKDLSNQLNRDYSDMNSYAKKGIDFEKEVYNILGNGRTEADIEGIKSSVHFKRILRTCNEGAFQKKIKKYFNISNYVDCKALSIPEVYFLYGKIDVFFPELLIDIKTTGNYSPNKYLGTIQHIMYTAISGIPKFKYLVVEWDLNDKIGDIYEEEYTMQNKDDNYKIMADTIAKAMTFLQKHPELITAYRENFCLY